MKDRFFVTDENKATWVASLSHLYRTAKGAIVNVADSVFGAGNYVLVNSTTVRSLDGRVLERR